MPVNVTLLFSREQYLAAAEAFLRGIERRIDAGLNPNVGSVASVFISRWDVAVDGQGAGALCATSSASPIAKRTYKAYRDLLDSPRWQRAFNAGARPQRLLWASTGTKDPEGLRHPLRQGARRAVHREHDAGGHTEGPRRPRRARRDPARATAATAKRCWRSSPKAGIDVDALAAQLQDEGAQVVRQILERTDGVVDQESKRQLSRNR